MLFDGYSDFVVNKQPLMTEEQYAARVAIAIRLRDTSLLDLKRALRPRDITDKDRQGIIAKSNAKVMDDMKTEGAMNVIDESSLTKLPYFSVVTHTLKDMMHVTNVIIGGHMVKVVKGRLASYSTAPRPVSMAAPVAPEPFDPDRIFLSHSHAKRTKDYDAAKIKYDQLNRTFKQEAQLASFYNAYHMNAGDISHVERMYRVIEAPLNIAPHSKMPFQQRGQMTAHDWVNFTKVYGKYLFLCNYLKTDRVLLDETWSNVPMKGLSMVMDLLTSCLAANATAAVKIKTKTQAAHLAIMFDKFIPSIEKSIMMHTLVFHMPDTIRLWGPSRGYWCFPFER